MSSPESNALEALLLGAYSEVNADDVCVVGLEVHTGEGRVFGIFPDEQTRNAAADLLRRALRAADEVQR